jgi:hypothetical protein
MNRIPLVFFFIPPFSFPVSFLFLTFGFWAWFWVATMELGNGKGLRRIGRGKTLMTEPGHAIHERHERLEDYRGLDEGAKTTHLIFYEMKRHELCKLSKCLLLPFFSLLFPPYQNLRLESHRFRPAT